MVPAPAPQPSVGRTRADSSADVERLRLVLLRLARQIRSNSRSEITPSQMAVISTLLRHGPCTVSQIAEYEQVQAPSASRIVTHLEDRGLVERNSDPTDRRRTLIVLSPRAHRFIAEVRSAGASWLASRLDKVGDHDLALLYDAVPVLERLLGPGE